MDFLQKRIRQQDLSRKEGESKDFQWVINYSNLNLLPPFGKMCLLNLHQLGFFTGGIKFIENIYTIFINELKSMPWELGVVGVC